MDVSGRSRLEGLLTGLEKIISNLLAEIRRAKEPQIPELTKDVIQRITQLIGETSANEISAGIEEVLGDESHFVLYPQRYEFYVNFGDGVQKVHLTPIEFRVMEYLMRNSGKALFNQDILNAGWEPQNTLQSDLSYVKVVIMSLRKKLGVQANYIRTIRGVGYEYNIFSTSISNEAIGSDSGIEKRVLHYKDLTLDLAEWVLYKGDKQIHLSSTEFIIMKMLMETEGKALTARQLLAFRESKVPKDYEVYEVSDERHASTFIHNLRAKIGEGYIVTVRGVGYKLP